MRYSSLGIGFSRTRQPSIQPATRQACQQVILQPHSVKLVERRFRPRLFMVFPEPGSAPCIRMNAAASSELNIEPIQLRGGRTRPHIDEFPKFPPEKTDCLQRKFQKNFAFCTPERIHPRIRYRRYRDRDERCQRKQNPFSSRFSAPRGSPEQIIDSQSSDSTSDTRARNHRKMIAVCL